MSYQPPLRTLQSEPTSSEAFKEALFQNFAIVKDSLSTIAHKKITQNIVEKYTSVGKQIIFDSENLNVELNRFQHYLFLEMTHRETNKVKILGNPSNIKTLNLQINFDSEKEEEQSSEEEQQPTIPVNSVKGVQRILKTCKYIQQLTLAFNDMSLTPEEVEQLSQTLQVLKHLKSITLDINVPTINSLITLSQSLQSLPLLSLSITSYPSEVIPQNLETFKELNTKIAQISSLQHISFQNVPISQELSGLSNLKSLQLYYTPIQQLTLQQSESLQKLAKNLQYLTLQTQDNNQLQEAGFTALIQALKSAENLVQLDLQIQDCSIQMAETPKIFQIFPSYTKLKSLKVYIPSFTGVQGVEILSQNLVSLVNLHKLNLYFEANNGIKDEGAQILAKGLQKLVELRDLKLSFYSSGFNAEDGMKAGGAKALGDSFKNLQKLVNLDLFISNKNSITTEGAKGLAQGFEQLGKLEYLKLFIGKDNNIEELGAKEIGIALSKLSSHLKTAFLKICFKDVAYEQLPKSVARN